MVFMIPVPDAHRDGNLRYKLCQLAAAVLLQRCGKCFVLRITPPGKAGGIQHMDEQQLNFLLL
jgi:hypothetical protein